MLSRAFGPFPWRRVLRMAAAWSILGMGAGVAVASSTGPGLVSYAANIVAGVIVFLPLGVMLGLFFDASRASLVGAVAGLFFGVIAGGLSGRSPGGDPLLGRRLVVGGLVGATVGPTIRLTTSTLARLAGLVSVGLRKREA
jgi:hypothetical protein